MRAWRDNRSEDGYASLSVAGLMAGLSLLAIGYSNLSTSKARLLAVETTILEKDIAIEGLFNQTAARIAARNLSINNSWQSRVYEERAFQIRLSFENTKADVNRASTAQINQKLETLIQPGDASRLAARLTGQRSRTATPYPSPVHVRALLEDKISYGCFREYFTVYRSPATQNRRQKGKQAFAEDGAIIRIEIRTHDETVPRALDAAILLTGKPADPVWVLDWQRLTDIDKEACPNA